MNPYHEFAWNSVFLGKDVYKRQVLRPWQAGVCLLWTGAEGGNKWWNTGRPDAVSYTHLDVYKRQD